jgi:hypothetical protein
VTCRYRTEMRSFGVSRLTLTQTSGWITQCRNSCVAQRPLHSHNLALLACPYICRSRSTSKFRVQRGRPMSCPRNACSIAASQTAIIQERQSRIPPVIQNVNRQKQRKKGFVGKELWRLTLEMVTSHTPKILCSYKRADYLV